MLIMNLPYLQLLYIDFHSELFNNKEIKELSKVYHFNKIKFGLFSQVLF
jgi:hypothetical protein